PHLFLRPTKKSRSEDCACFATDASSTRNYPTLKVGTQRNGRQWSSRATTTSDPMATSTWSPCQQFAEAPPDVQVEMPWQAQGNCGTKLRTRCWAVCTWVTRMPASQIIDLGGMVPPRLMIEISTKALGALGSG